MKQATRNGHDIVELKQYVDARHEDLIRLIKSQNGNTLRALDEQDQKDNIRFDAITKATDLARENVDLKFLGTNEWRQTVSDQQTHFPTREEMKQTIGAVENTQNGLVTTVSELRSSVANLEGRLVAGGIGVTVLNIAVVIIAHFLPGK